MATKKVDWKLFKRGNNVKIEKAALKNGGFKYRVTTGAESVIYPDYESFRNRKS